MSERRLETDAERRARYALINAEMQRARRPIFLRRLSIIIVLFVVIACITYFAGRRYLVVMAPLYWVCAFTYLRLSWQAFRDPFS